MPPFVTANNTCPIKVVSGEDVYQYHCWHNGFCVSLDFFYDDYDDCKDGTDEGIWEKLENPRKPYSPYIPGFRLLS